METSENSTEASLNESISSAEDSHARTLAQSGFGLGCKRETGADYGPNMQGFFASFDRASCSWKTSQACLQGGLETFSETWPTSGTMRTGKCYQRAPLALH